MLLSRYVRAGWGVAALLVAGCSGADLVLPDQAAPTALTVTSGDGQSGIAGSPLPAALVVILTDQVGRPVVGRSVVFTVASGSGSVNPGSATTDSAGHAATRWTLGPEAGSQSVGAALDGSTTVAATFHATADPGGGARIEVDAGEGQAATVGSPLPNPLVVRAFDDNGNPAAGVDVHWSAGSGGSIDPATSTTGTDGRASAKWTLGAGAGSQTALASADGLAGSPVTFTATAAVGAAGRLSITQQPSSSAASGEVLSRQPAVQLLDTNGNPVRQAGLAVSATISGGPSGASLQGGTTAATDNTGTASFSGLVIVGPTGAYQLTFGGAGLQAVTSTSIQITAGAAAGLKIAQQPSQSAQSGQQFPQQPIIQLVDGAGNAVQRSGVPITATIASGGGTLQGSTTINTDGQGTATFHDLSISGADGSRTLIFAASGYTSITSAAISVVGAPPPPPSNHAPVATLNQYGLDQGGTLTVHAPGVLDNDTDADGDRLTAILEQAPAHGTLSLHADGSFTYTADPGFAGVDTATYQADDGQARSAPATIEFYISASGGGGDQGGGGAGQQARGLGFVVQPPNVRKDAVMVPPVLVAVLDGGGNLVASSTAEVTIRLNTSQGGGRGNDPKLHGHTSQHAVGGIAVFADLSVRGGTGTMTLTASAKDLTSATSSSFEVR